MGSYFVVVTCRNSENNIERALLSLKAQTIPPAYVVVIDDGSKDNTAEILRKLQSRWSSLHIITNPDLGYDIARVVCNWNKAIKYVQLTRLPRVDYHMISTDDTVYEPSYAEKIMLFMDADQMISIASGDYEGQVGTITPHGAGRFVRTEFFEKYHGLYPEKMGYESLVLHTSMQHGYTFSVLTEARFEHTRPLGKNHQFYEFGASMRTLGYHPLFVLGRFLMYFTRGRPIGRIGAIYMLYYYLSYRPKYMGYDSMYDLEIRQYIRKHQLKRIRKKIFALSSGAR